MAVAHIYKAQCGLESNVSFSLLPPVLRKTLPHTYTRTENTGVHTCSPWPRLLLVHFLQQFFFASLHYLCHLVCFLFFFIPSQLSQHYSFCPNLVSVVITFGWNPYLQRKCAVVPLYCVMVKLII